MGQCIARIKKRPIIIIFMAIITLPLCAYEQFNSITKKFGSFSLLFKDDFMTSLSNLADGIKNAASTPWLMALTILVSILFVLAVCVVLGILFGGYFQNLYMAVYDIPKKKGDFKLGINRHFAKMAVYFTVLITLSILLLVLLLFSIVPFAMSLDMFFAGDSSVIFKMMLLAVLTLLLGYLAIVFFSMYFSYMIPSIIGFKKGGVIVSFKMTNGYCWYLIPRTTLFLFLMLCIQALMLALGYGTATGGMAVLCFIINWILKTLVLFGYLYYVFNTFTIMKEDMFTAEA